MNRQSSNINFKCINFHFSIVTANNKITHAGSYTTINNSSHILFFSQCIQLQYIFRKERNINHIFTSFNNCFQCMKAHKTGYSSYYNIKSF